MGFTAKAQVYKASIQETVLGVGDKALTLGGSKTQPLCSFDETWKNAPAVGVEVSDLPFDTEGLPELAAFYAGCESFGDRVRRASEMEGASFVCLHFEGADPGGENKNVEEIVALAKEAAAATDLPLVITGCKNVEKDQAIFTAVSDALPDRNPLFLSAREEDYKTIGAACAMANGHKVGAESAVDINLAKQLNVLMTQLGVAPASIVMNLGSAAAGYGFEYVASTLDRVKSAALEQNDAMLQMPVMTPVALETWSVKEAIMNEADMPEWGSREERAVEMEIVTASACLVSGSDAVILRHPASVKTISAMLAALA
ncbi:MAG: acetyl-CoA decarbonylase/synthase complex subunit delta [Desulfovibrio sp.]|nr:acetyl-CoA decarbonylase/synthase complex subunit delta [Desulfovibrio sp.]